MNEEFHRRQVEADQKLEQGAQRTHATMETYQLEQHEADLGHQEAAKGVEFNAQPPSLWQRIRKMLGM